MPLSKLLRTELHLAGLTGSVDLREGYAVIRTPENPKFYFGNMLMLDAEPEDIEHWLGVFEAEFGPDVEHRCMEWAGEQPERAFAKCAQALDLRLNSGLEMILDELPAARSDWVVRPLSLERDWTASVELNRQADESERDPSASYAEFKERLRATRRGWIQAGQATWWGAFDGERLVGQCGLVPCAELGRFQSVETHPDYRRRGVCGQLMTDVARHALQELGLESLILGAEIDGPASALYASIGFQEGQRSHSLLRSESKLIVRPEGPSDHAGVRSLVAAAFGTQDEVRLIEALRAEPGVLSLVAEQAGSLLGHILFSPLTLEGSGEKPRAVALAPVAVRPLAQGRGVGSFLIREGLAACRDAGFELCVLIGHSDYYPRFGFEPATPLGLSNPFGVTDEHFMALELQPGAFRACAGALGYAEAFSTL